MAELKHISVLLDEFKKTDEMQKISDFINIIDSWKVIGGSISSCSVPEKFENGCLYIKCKDGIWAQELSMMKEQILNKLNKINKKKIKDIRFYI